MKRTLTGLAVVAAVLVLSGAPVHAVTNGGSLSGDRRSEAVLKQSNGDLLAAYNGGYTADHHVSWAAAKVVGVGWLGPDTGVYFADLSGDGRKEGIAVEGVNITAWHNNGWTAARTVAWDVKATIISDNFSVPSDAIYFADLDGDGRAEFITREGDTLYALHNNGYLSDGRVLWGTKVDFSYGWTGVFSSGIYFTDLNGDGRAEVVKKAGDCLFSAYNGGYRSDGRIAWGAAKTLDCGWIGFFNDEAYFADLDGDGRSEAIGKIGPTLYNKHNHGWNSSTQTVSWNGFVDFSYGWPTAGAQVKFA